MKLNCSKWMIVSILGLLSWHAAVADDWPQWMGPERDGVWRETGIITRFPAGGPPVRWRVPVGGGYAGPAVAAGRVYVTDRVLAKGSELPADPFDRGQTGGMERVLCLDDATGKQLWKHEYDCPYTISYAVGPRTTPTVADGKVYTLGAEGNLFCFDAAKGDVLWQRDFKKDYNLKISMWGCSASPLIDGQMLICIVGGDGSTVVAFDKDSGKEIWRALSAKDPAYCPPVIYETGGKRQLLIWHAESINSLDPATGKPYWSIPIEASFGMAIALPRKEKDLLFLTSYKDHSMMLKLDDKQPAAKVLWRGERKTSMYSTMATPFFENGYIYGACADGEFRCIKAETGARLWETFAPTTEGRRQKWGTAFVVKNGDHFFLFNELGDLIIANLSPKGYEELSRAHLLDPTSLAGGREVLWSHPAFANRSIYARNDKELISVSLAAGK